MKESERERERINGWMSDVKLQVIRSPSDLKLTSIINQPLLINHSKS